MTAVVAVEEFEGREVVEVAEHGRISEYEIMRSNAGYYVGNYYFDEEADTWFPNERVSGYFKSIEAATPELKFWIFARKSEQ